ncbi:MAG: hypothetical protein ABI315_07530 [Bacteroidia bacterium]
MSKCYLCAIIIFCFFKTESVAFTIQNQDNDDIPSKKQYFLFSTRASVTVPHPIANSAFKKTFVGIYNINLDFNTFIYRGLYIGASYKNNLFKITPTKIASYNVDSLGNLNPYPTMHSNAAAVKVGYDIFIGEENRVIYSISTSVGNYWTKYGNFVSKPAGKKIIKNSVTSYIEPEMALNFMVESNFAIGVNISYTMLNSNFDPYKLSLNDWKGYGKNNESNTQYLSFGFGFFYSFYKKK